MKNVIWSLLLVLAFPAIALSGVVLTDASGDRTYLSEGRLKHVGKDGQSQIFLSKSGEIILIDAERQAYAKGTVADFCRMGETLMDSVMAGMSPQEREMMKQFMGAAQDAPKQPDPVVSVADQGSGERIAGLETHKYRVTVDGQPYAELWLSRDEALMREVGGLHELLKMTAEMTACMEAGIGMSIPVAPESTPQYQALYQKGYPLKVVSLESGPAEVEEEVVRIEKRRLGDDEFRAPTGYRQIPFAEFIGAQELF